MSKHEVEKCGKTAYFLYSKFTKRHNSFKKWLKVTTLELDLQYIRTNIKCKISAQYAKACRRKVRKTAHFLYSEITKRHNSLKKLTQSDDTRTWSVVHYCKVMCNISKHVGEKCEKWADGDPDRRRVGRTETLTDITIP